MVSLLSVIIAVTNKVFVDGSSWDSLLCDWQVRALFEHSPSSGHLGTVLRQLPWLSESEFTYLPCSPSSLLPNLGNWRLKQTNKQVTNTLELGKFSEVLNRKTIDLFVPRSLEFRKFTYKNKEKWGPLSYALFPVQPLGYWEWLELEDRLSWGKRSHCARILILFFSALYFL